MERDKATSDWMCVCVCTSVYNIAGAIPFSDIRWPVRSCSKASGADLEAFAPSLLGYAPRPC